MVISDPIYGTFDITEEVLIELLAEPAVQRLKGIKQGGAYTYVYPVQDFSRYEHSVGCMLLVKHLGASLEEQISALLHDVSHTTFSHVIDYVYKNDRDQDHHEKIKESILEKSNIPAILKKYNLDPEYIFNEHNFSLQEQSLPALCADRVDYSLRNLYYYLEEPDKAKYYFSHLINHEGVITFNERDAAQSYARDFLKLDQIVWTDAKNLAAYYFLAEIIEKSLSKGIITEDDFLGTDDELIRKIEQSSDNEVRRQLLKLETDFSIISADKSTYSYKLITKPRVVNPSFIENGSVNYVFNIDPALISETEEHSKMVKEGRFVRVE